MRFVFTCVAIFISLTCVSCQSSKDTSTDLPATALKPYGRYIIDDNKYLELISSAVHFGFSFEGKECKVFVSLPDSNQHSYIQYELDGAYQKMIRIDGKNKKPLVLTAPTNGKHTIWIYKTTEATTGAIIIQKITGNNLQALQVPDAPLIDFIGNSITCGADADSAEMACSTGEYHDHHNSYYAYGFRVARALGINFILSSVSGIGIYRNWNSDGPAMPQVFEKADFQNTSSRLWDFGLYNPQIVSIALGTNDMSKGDGKKPRLPFDSASFISHYIKFVQLIKSKYPDAQIVLLSSPMINGDNRILLQNCLTAVKENIDSLYSSGKKIAVYFFNPMQAHGCSGHPSVAEHAILANELIPFFKNLLK